MNKSVISFFFLTLAVATIYIYTYNQNHMPTDENQVKSEDSAKDQYTKVSKAIFDEDVQMIPSIIETLNSSGESADDFYVSIESVVYAGTNLYVAHLWYAKDFEAKNRVIGNPSGKSRDLYWNIDFHKIMKVVYWQ